MSDALSVDMRASLTWLLTETMDLSSVSDYATLEYKRSLTDGTAANQADLLWHDQRTVTAASFDDLDLIALNYPIFGGELTVSFATVKALLLINTEVASGNDLRLGGAGSGAFAAPFNGDQDAQVEIAADGCLLLVNKTAGWAVDAGDETLRVENPGGADITYQIVIVGASA